MSRKEISLICKFLGLGCPLECTVCILTFWHTSFVDCKMKWQEKLYYFLAKNGLSILSVSVLFTLLQHFRIVNRTVRTVNTTTSLFSIPRATDFRHLSLKSYVNTFSNHASILLFFEENYGTSDQTVITMSYDCVARVTRSPSTHSSFLFRIS